MAKGKVISSTPNGDPWTDNKGVKKYNFIIKFEGADDSGEVPERYIFVSEKETNDVFVVGKELEYNKKTTREGAEWKVRANVSGKSYSWPAIEIPKQGGGNGFGGGGGGKSYAKTKEQELNTLVGTCASYAKDLMCHRINLGDSKDPKDLVRVHTELAVGMFNGIKDLIK